MKKIYTYITIVFIGLISSLAFPVVASAHLEGGVDIEQEMYTVDFGHTPEFPKTGDITVMAMSIINNETKAVVDPEKVWLRISGPSGVVFAGYLATEAEHIDFSYVFSEPGDYEITARFPTIETIEEITLPLKVEAGIMTVTEPTPPWYTVGRNLFTGLVVILVCIIIVKYYTTKQARTTEE